jgi:hypothetical protein
MNRLICPECSEPSYCASLTGPIRCANEECGTLLLPGDDVKISTDRRILPRFTIDTAITVEYLDQDRRVVERASPFLDVSVIAFSTVLQHYAPLGSTVVVELSNAAVDGKPWRLRGIVREVRPADGDGDDDGFRVAIEVSTEAR